MTRWTFAGRSAPNGRGSAVLLLAALSAAATGPPASATEIRTHAANRVPACVTPERLMDFLAARNARLDPRYRNIARFYKQHGDAWRVRWDFAFFQMVIETNALAFRRPDGRPGDVKPAQNNFAGLGTTGGGVPGDSYPDVSTGVLAQIQHLVAYSGERLAAPVGARTRLKQDDIVSASQRLGRPVRFADLARRWATDPSYGRSIAWIAEQFRVAHCTPAHDTAIPAPRPALPSAARSALGGEAQLVRAPHAATRGTASAHPPPAPSPSPAVRTVWRQSRPGEVPLLPQAGPAPAPRRLAAVAAVTTAAPASKETRPIAAPALPPAQPAASPPAAAIAAPQPSPEIGPEAQQPTIALAAAAAPFAAAPLFAEVHHAHFTCRILMASYGGTRTVLLRSTSRAAVDLVILSVAPGFEATAAVSYIRTRLPGGTIEAAFPDRDSAIARAREICPAAS
jgi:hypothetical protein